MEGDGVSQATKGKMERGAATTNEWGERWAYVRVRKRGLAVGGSVPLPNSWDRGLITFSEQKGVDSKFKDGFKG
jgi:hypothetical protein